MKRLIHKIAHKLGWYSGYADSHWKGEDLIMCFRCGTCGKLSSCEKVPDHILYPERQSDLLVSHQER